MTEPASPDPRRLARAGKRLARQADIQARLGALELARTLYDEARQQLEKARAAYDAQGADRAVDRLTDRIGSLATRRERLDGSTAQAQLLGQLASLLTLLGGLTVDGWAAWALWSHGGWALWAYVVAFIATGGVLYVAATRGWSLDTMAVGALALTAAATTVALVASPVVPFHAYTLWRWLGLAAVGLGIVAPLVHAWRWSPRAMFWGLATLGAWCSLPLLFAAIDGLTLGHLLIMDGFWRALPTLLQPLPLMVIAYLPAASLIVLSATARQLVFGGR